MDVGFLSSCNPGGTKEIAICGIQDWRVEVKLFVDLYIPVKRSGCLLAGGQGNDQTVTWPLRRDSPSSNLQGSDLICVVDNAWHEGDVVVGKSVSGVRVGLARDEPAGRPLRNWRLLLPRTPHLNRRKACRLLHSDYTGYWSRVACSRLGVPQSVVGRYHCTASFKPGIVVCGHNQPPD